MDAIQELTKINYTYVFTSVVAALIGIKAFVSLFEWIVSKIGLETKWMKQKREEHDLLVKTSENLLALQQHWTCSIQMNVMMK